MFAQLGTIVFEPLSGFHALGDNQDATVAQYGLLAGKPYPQAIGPELRELSIGMRLHQRFIKVKEAVLQLRAYLENGTTIALLWGNGELEGRFLVRNISTNAEELDNIGNVYCVGLGVTLLEVPAEHLLEVKQADSYKAAFGIGEFVAPVLPVRPLKPVKLWLLQLREAMKYANIIRGLAYGGAIPGPALGGGSLTTVIARARTNIAVLQQQYGVSGADFGIPDQTGNMAAVASTLVTLQGINPVTDAAGFAVAHTAYQAAVGGLFVGSWLLSARDVTRSSVIF